MDNQLKKGLLDICVLAVLARGQSYGYKIVQDLTGVLNLSDTALYPVLKRLESNNAIRSFSQEYNGRIRKYYTITQTGKSQLQNHIEELNKLQQVCDFIKNQYEAVQDNVYKC